MEGLGVVAMGDGRNVMAKVTLLRRRMLKTGWRWLWMAMADGEKAESNTND